MDWLAFFAAMTGHLAWPVVAATVILAFKAPVSDRIRAIRKLKYQDLELDLTEELQALSRKADQARRNHPVTTPVATKPTIAPTTSFLGEAETVARSAPVAAILLAWAAVEQKLAETVTRLAISPDPPGRTTAVTNIEMLSSDGRFDAGLLELVQGLRRVRNELAHPKEGQIHIKSHDAVRYVELSREVIEHLHAQSR
jgi:hypothetical protein